MAEQKQVLLLAGCNLNDNKFSSWVDEHNWFNMQKTQNRHPLRMTILWAFEEKLSKQFLVPPKLAI
jgi:hypothetical protein